jgi:hypothetical protein
MWHSPRREGQETTIAETAALPDVIHRFIQAFNAGDRRTVEALMLPDAAYSTSFGEVLHEPHGVADRLWAWRAALPDLELHVTQASTSGSHGAFEGYLTGTHRAALVLPRHTVPATGRSVRVPQSYLFTLYDGKIAILSSSVEGADLLRALGVEGRLRTLPILPGHLLLLYQHRFHSPRREGLFLASLSFCLTFAGVRLLVHAIRANRGPFRNVSGPGGTHIHHLVWGITLLLGTGYAWLAQIGTGADRRRWIRSTAALYGAGSALTLDEFALWLNLEDVYWAPQGRESVDAVLLFGSVLVTGWWGFPFLRAAFHLLVSRGKSAVGGRVTGPSQP